MVRLVSRCHARGLFDTPEGKVDRLAPGSVFLAMEEDAKRLLARRSAELAPEPEKPKKKAKAADAEG